MSDSGNAPPTISYTRKRTTTKTRTAASSSRRRKNLPLVHASGGGGDNNQDDGGKDQHSWFARKSAGWTDEEIKSHLVSGGTTKGGASFSMVGDVILGDGPNERDRKKRKVKRRSGPMFAWEEEEDGGNDHDEGGYNNHAGNRMTAAPTLADIMDERDEADFMTLKVGNQYQMKQSIDAADSANKKSSPNSKTKSSRLRSQNAALAELAQVSGMDHGGGQTLASSANESIGYRLLRVCGYRSRLGMAFVPLSGHVGGINDIDNQLKEIEKDGKVTHEVKWLLSKRLRAIKLPSIQNGDANKNSNQTNGGDPKSTVLTIPQPKINRHGIGFDPFKNAPEFRAFHEQRRALAQKRGRGTEASNEGESGKRGDRYFTDDLRKDNRQALWDRKTGPDGEDSDDMSDPSNINSKDKSQHSHYAADRDYSDFIGGKASSGFANDDADDANIYNDDDQHIFPSRAKDTNDENGQYALEVQSPVASDEEDAGISDGLFGKIASIGSRRDVPGKRRDAAEDKGKMADAWSAWGMGTVGSDNVHGAAATKATTVDGKPPLPGFKLSQSKIIGNDNTRAKADAPKRWAGPDVPSGYILKRHVFPPEDSIGCDAKAGGSDRMDSGLGLDLMRKVQASRSSVPAVLPPSNQQKQTPASGKMLAKDGTELNFHAVKASMKNRFVSSAGTSNTPESESKTEDNSTQDLDKEEWVQVTVTPWLPTRLLCKRWGVPVPSTVGMTAEKDNGKSLNKEEEYFRQTIFEPVVAQREKNAGTPKGGDLKQAMTAKTDNTQSEQSLLHETIDKVEGNDLPPTRPSVEIYRSIYDVESDMDISSDDDDEPDKEDQNGSHEYPVHMSIQSNPPFQLDSTTNNSKEVIQNNNVESTINTRLGPQEEIKLDPGYSSEGSHHSNSSSSVLSQRRRKRHRHEDRKKRKRKEKHRRRHRREYSGSESDEDSKRHDSDDRKRRKKKHKSKSRSRHKSRHKD